MRKIVIPAMLAIPALALMLSTPASAHTPVQLAHLNSSYSICLAAPPAGGAVRTARCSWPARSQQWILAPGPHVTSRSGLCLTARASRALVTAPCGQRGDGWIRHGHGTEWLSERFRGQCLTAPRHFGPATLARCGSRPAYQIWTWLVQG